MEFDCALVFTIMRPVIKIQAQINRRAVNRIQRIVKTELVPGRTCQSTVKDFLKQRLEYLRIAAVHCLGQGRFGNDLHAEVIQTVMVCKQTVFNFPQGVFAGNLRVKARQKLPPCGEMLAITVAG